MAFSTCCTSLGGGGRRMRRGSLRGPRRRKQNDLVPRYDTISDIPYRACALTNPRSPGLHAHYIILSTSVLLCFYHHHIDKLSSAHRARRPARFICHTHHHDDPPPPHTHFPYLYPIVPRTPLVDLPIPTPSIILARCAALFFSYLIQRYCLPYSV